MIDDAWWEEKERRGWHFLGGTSRSELLQELRELYAEYKKLKEIINSANNKIRIKETANSANEFTWTPKFEMTINLENPKKPIYVGKIIEVFLKTHGYDGLYSDFDYDGCSCSLDELAPCVGNGYGENITDCKPGYKVPCDCGEGCNFHIGEKA